jgi:hypothetical protein
MNKLKCIQKNFKNTETGANNNIITRSDFNLECNDQRNKETQVLEEEDKQIQIQNNLNMSTIFNYNNNFELIQNLNLLVGVNRIIENHLYDSSLNLLNSLINFDRSLRKLFLHSEI